MRGRDERRRGRERCQHREVTFLDILIPNQWLPIPGALSTGKPLLVTIVGEQLL